VIDNYLNQSVTLYGRTGSNVYGEPGYAAGAVMPARVIFRKKLVTDSRGQQVISTTEFIFSPLVTVNVDDKISYSGIEHIVIAVEEHADINGVALYRKAVCQ